MLPRRELLRALAVLVLAGCTTRRSPPAPATDGGPPRLGAPPTAAPRAGAAVRRGTDGDARAAAPPAREHGAAAEPPPSPTPTPDAAIATDGVDAPATTAPPAQPPAAADGGTRAVTAVGRAALGLPAAAAGGRAHTITGLALHHTASPTTGASSAPGRWRGITAAHRERGWVDVAYHWGVDVAGNVYQLRDPALAGDTATGYDPAGWFLVVCEGDFESSSPPAAMLEAVADVLAHGARQHGVAPATLRGHRDLAATLCPGANLQAQLPALRRGVERRLAAGGVRLVVSDDPGRVAAIEAG